VRDNGLSSAFSIFTGHEKGEKEMIVNFLEREK
jgi:hypothetical protein